MTKYPKHPIIQALHIGKTICYKSTEPRYYKLIDSKLVYSDDLKVWKPSKASIPVFMDDSKWEVL